MTNDTHAQHTPGPWEVSATGHRILASEIEAGERTPYRPRTELAALAVDNIANARLIAAAPELLAALRDACDRIAGIVDLFRRKGQHESAGEYQAALDAARAAIRKAEGK